MAIPTLGNSATNGGNNHTSEDVSLSISSNSGRVLLCNVNFYYTSTGASVSSVVFDPGGSDEASFTQEITVDITSTVQQQAELWYLVLGDGVSSGTYTIRVTYSTTMSRNNCIAWEVNGADTTDPIGATVSAVNYTDEMTDTVTTTEANSLVMGMGNMKEEVTFTATNGTEYTEGTSVNLLSAWVGYDSAASTGDYTISAQSSDTPNNDNWCFIVAEILEAAAGAPTVNMDKLTLASSLKAMSITPGAISATMDKLTLASSIKDHSITPGAVTVSADKLTLASSIKGMSITPGGVTINMDKLTLTGAPLNMSIIVAGGAQTVNVDKLILAGAPLNVSITPGGITVNADKLILASTELDMTITPGEVTITMDALTLASSIKDILIVTAQQIAMDALALASAVSNTVISNVTGGLAEVKEQVFKIFQHRRHRHRR